MKMNEEKLGNIAELANRGRRKLKKDERQPGKYPYCGAGGVIEHVNSYTHEGDYLLLTAVGNGLGAKKKTSYLINGKFHAGTNVHVLKLSKSVDPQYIVNFLNWTDLKPYAKGVAMLALPAKMIPDIPIKLPSLTNQREFVRKLEETSNAERFRVMDEHWE